uniref:Uncharacterized protein n=1 Tax=Anopheles culicifacies TaxID=139723 RepID=A0A182LS24_9DIPT
MDSCSVGQNEVDSGVGPIQLQERQESTLDRVTDRYFVALLFFFRYSGVNLSNRSRSVYSGVERSNWSRSKYSRVDGAPELRSQIRSSILFGLGVLLESASEFYLSRLRSSIGIGIRVLPESESVFKT